VVSSVEAVHIERVELTLGQTPVLQIDLSKDVSIVFADEKSRPKATRVVVAFFGGFVLTFVLFARL
jgi:hypothetical protein